MKPGHEGWTQVAPPEEKYHKAASKNLSELAKQIKDQQVNQNPYWASPSKEVLTSDREKLSGQIEKAEDELKSSKQALEKFLEQHKISKDWQENLAVAIQNFASKKDGYQAMQRYFGNHFPWIKAEMLPELTEHTQKIHAADKDLAALKNKDSFISDNLASIEQKESADPAAETISTNQTYEKSKPLPDLKSEAPQLLLEQSVSLNDHQNTLDVTYPGLTLDQVAFAKKHGLLKTTGTELTAEQQEIIEKEIAQIKELVAIKDDHSSLPSNRQIADFGCAIIDDIHDVIENKIINALEQAENCLSKNEIEDAKKIMEGSDRLIEFEKVISDTESLKAWQKAFVGAPLDAAANVWKLLVRLECDPLGLSKDIASSCGKILFKAGKLLTVGDVWETTPEQAEKYHQLDEDMQALKQTLSKMTYQELARKGLGFAFECAIFDIFIKKGVAISKRSGAEAVSALEKGATPEEALTKMYASHGKTVPQQLKKLVENHPNEFKSVPARLTKTEQALAEKVAAREANAQGVTPFANSTKKIKVGTSPQEAVGSAESQISQKVSKCFETSGIADTLKCHQTKESVLERLKSLLENGKKIEDNIIEAFIDKNTKILFRKDFNKHALPTSRGYPKNVNIDHYNIEIQRTRYPGATRFPNKTVKHAKRNQIK